MRYKRQKFLWWLCLVQGVQTWMQMRDAAIMYEEWWSLRMGLDFCFKQKWPPVARHLRPRRLCVIKWWRVPSTLTSPGFCLWWDCRSRLGHRELQWVSDVNSINYITSWARRYLGERTMFCPVLSAISSATGTVEEQCLCPTKSLCQTAAWAVFLTSHRSWLLCYVQSMASSKIVTLPKDSLWQKQNRSCVVEVKEW